MFDFNTVLTDNETIIYQGKPIPGKGKFNIKKTLSALLFLIFIEIAILITQENIFDNLLFIIIILIFILALLQAMKYNTIIRNKIAKENLYCMTNFRVLQYNTKENKLYYGYLARFSIIEIFNENNGYGDVSFSVNLKTETGDKFSLKKIKKLSKDRTNMLEITFLCIKDPKEIVKLAEAAREKLK